MAFIRKQDTGNGEVFKFEKVGDTLTGVYLGSAEFDGDYGRRIKYMFKTDTGTRVVFGSTHIDQLLESEAPGQLMRLAYVGNKPTKRGKPMKRFELDIDDSYRASQSEVDAALAVSDNQEDELGEDEEVQTGAAKPPVNAGAPSSSTRARVGELLKGNRRVS